MSVVRGDTTRRWITVLVAIGLVGVTPLLISARPVASTGLSAAEVVAAAKLSAAVPHDGLVEIEATLGIPKLPVASDNVAILDETTRARTWWASTTSWRVDTLTGTGQAITFATVNGHGNVRQWSFENDTVTDVIVDPALRFPRTDDLVPPQAARRILGWMGPTDRVEPLGARRVAGIAAAGARIVPGDARSSVGHVDLWVDPANGLPLQVEVFAVGGTRPVLSTRFLDVQLGRPAADVLAPTFVPTARQRTTSTPDLLSRISAIGNVPLPDRIGDLDRITTGVVPVGIGTYGVGFTRVMVVPIPGRFMDDLFDSVSKTGTKLTVAGGEASLLSSPLVTVIVARTSVDGQGFLVAGTLKPAALQATVAALLAAR